MLELTNEQLYERMKEFKKFSYPANYEKVVRDFQESDLCRELRRRAEADKEFESTISPEMMSVVFPERFKEVQ